MDEKQWWQCREPFVLQWPTVSSIYDSAMECYSISFHGCYAKTTFSHHRVLIRRNYFHFHVLHSNPMFY